jgi:hypothetical protein
MAFKGFPKKTGLYDPGNEKDSCGVVEASLFWKAFKCHSLGRPSDKKWSSLDGVCP